MGNQIEHELKPVTFEEAFMPHVDAAYNVARWLTRNDMDAQDVVQEALLRALKFFHRFHGDDGRAWLLKIVRNTSYTWLKQNRGKELPIELDENIYLNETDAHNPEANLLKKDQKQKIFEAMQELPHKLREVLILREFEEISYKEIAAIAGIPVGTVMSRLARARRKLLASISGDVVLPARLAHAFRRQRTEQLCALAEGGNKSVAYAVL